MVLFFHFRVARSRGKGTLTCFGFPVGRTLSLSKVAHYTYFALFTTNLLCSFMEGSQAPAHRSAQGHPAAAAKSRAPSFPPAAKSKSGWTQLCFGDNPTISAIEFQKRQSRGEFETVGTGMRRFTARKPPYSKLVEASRQGGSNPPWRLQ